ncbi:MAG TPA: hypothetical protein VN578_07145 [Candidatus Binatia bacterium]|nr:hypothetical protein [Candidatus Binatia bacterium]
MFAQQPRFLQPDRCLIRRDAQEKSLGLPWEIQTLRARYDKTDFSLQPQSQGYDGNVLVSNAVPHRRRPVLRVLSQTPVEQFSNLLRTSRQALGLGDPGHLDGCLSGWFFQPHIDQIQVEHFQQHVEQGANNPGRLAATPHGWKSEDADQIIDAATKVLDLLSGMFELHLHVRPS